MLSALAELRLWIVVSATMGATLARADVASAAEPVALEVSQVLWLQSMGAFQAVAEHAPRAIRLAEEDQRHDESLRLQLALAAAQHALGRFADASQTLDRAIARSRQASSPAAECAALSAKGANLILRRRWREAGEILEQGATLAERCDDDRLRANVFMRRGALFMARGQIERAQQAYYAARGTLKVSDSDPLLAEVLSSAAFAAGVANDANAASLALEAEARLETLPDDYQKGSICLRLARCRERLARSTDGATSAAEMRAGAWRLYGDAVRVGRETGSARLTGYGLAGTAELYESQARFDEALVYARQAAFLAQQRQMPDVLYRWQWQVGRLLRKQGKEDAATDAYRNAADTLRTVRADVAVGHGNYVSQGGDAASSSFRQAVGSLFLELADLHLTRATNEAEPSFQSDLRAARAAMESLKAAELEDYFHSECATLVTRDISAVDEMVGPGTAVVYVVSLEDRTEVLTTLPGGRLVRTKCDVGNRQLAAEVVEMRDRLEDRTSHAYRSSARRIFNWLVAPIEPLLAARGVRTLVFVPDENFRTIPPAALWDGKRFLVERYAVAVVPGLTLTRTDRPAAPRVLAAGQSQSEDGFQELPYVRRELEYLKESHGAVLLADRQFTYGRLRETLDANRFSVVHLASHGVFQPDASETFLLLHQRRLGLDDLSQLLQPNQYRGAPVELLTLSACQTAAGSDDGASRAALGLAGVALKAGARSALATLWYVNDYVSSDLVCDFYGELRSNPAAGKAEALRRAQVAFLKDPRYERYRHPCYWSPYLLIGSWQ